MSFLTDLKKLDTAREMLSIVGSTKGAIQQISANKSRLELQILAMKANTDDYTDADWQELQGLLNEINASLSELNNQ